MAQVETKNRATSSEETRKHVCARIEQEGVEFVLLWFSDIEGHLKSFAVFPGQHVHRGDTIGYVGDSGRSTGPHLHYEVRINDVPVNPHKYLRVTYAHVGGFAA